ncbi:hypothetical protein HDK77DRAFT_27949 [Phyllosticta capitalensis]
MEQGIIDQHCVLAQWPHTIIIVCCSSLPRSPRTRCHPLPICLPQLDGSARHERALPLKPRALHVTLCHAAPRRPRTWRLWLPPACHACAASRSEQAPGLLTSTAYQGNDLHLNSCMPALIRSFDEAPHLPSSSLAASEPPLDVDFGSGRRGSLWPTQSCQSLSKPPAENSSCSTSMRLPSPILETHTSPMVVVRRSFDSVCCSTTPLITSRPTTNYQTRPPPQTCRSRSSCVRSLSPHVPARYASQSKSFVSAQPVDPSGHVTFRTHGPL